MFSLKKHVSFAGYVFCSNSTLLRIPAARTSVWTAISSLRLELKSGYLADGVPMRANKKLPDHPICLPHQSYLHQYYPILTTYPRHLHPLHQGPSVAGCLQLRCLRVSAKAFSGNARPASASTSWAEGITDRGFPTMFV